MLLHTGGMLTLEHSFKLPQAIKFTKATCHLARNVQDGIRTTVRDFTPLSPTLFLCVCVSDCVCSPLVPLFPFT